MALALSVPVVCETWPNSLHLRCSADYVYQRCHHEGSRWRSCEPVPVQSAHMGIPKQVDMTPPSQLSP